MEEEVTLGKNTRIYEKFRYYSLADCNCAFCLFYKGKRRGCSLEVCCCAEEKAAAVAREQGVGILDHTNTFLPPAGLAVA